MDQTDRDLEALAAEVDGLRRWQRWSTALLGLLGIALILSLIVPRHTIAADVVEAGRYILTDGGQQRGMFRVQDGVPALILQDDLGVWRAILDLPAEGPGLALRRFRGQGGLTFTVTENRTVTELDPGPARPVSARLVHDAAGLRFLLIGEGSEEVIWESAPEATPRR